MSLTSLFLSITGVILLCIGLINMLYEAKALSVQKRLDLPLPHKLIMLMKLNKYLPFIGVLLLLASFIVTITGD
jgi:hypothetical protein